jgi:hypothetical protein
MAIEESCRLFSEEGGGYQWLCGVINTSAGGGVAKYVGGGGGIWWLSIGQ